MYAQISQYDLTLFEIMLLFHTLKFVIYGDILNLKLGKLQRWYYSFETKTNELRIGLSLCSISAGEL